MELPELRRQFEEWYEADVMPAEADWFKRYEDGEYYHSHTHDAWKAWQEMRRRLALPKSYGGSTFNAWGDQKEGCTVRIHFTDAKEAEEWFKRLADDWDRARSEG